jgi:glycosyltransferase involved in cell wall biosynthesis
MTSEEPAAGHSPGAATEAPSHKRIAILIVAYNAASTLKNVLDRIPAEVWEKVEEVIVFDNSSKDNTYLVGLGYKALHGKVNLSVFRNESNVGYGGNQIRGYRYVIEQGYDIVALLHSDGQYAPELLPELLAPLERGEADAVFGSRMLTPGGALKGGMPLYKFAGNKVLTAFENAMLGMSLSEFHSGYRLYSVEALKKIPFDKNTNEYHFDTQIIIQLHAAGMRIVEIPIPTYYGDEISYVNGFRYARDIALSVAQYELHELGLMHRPEFEIEAPLTLKKSPLSSHAQLMEMVGPPPRRILHIGCSRAELGLSLKQRGHFVFGVDEQEPDYQLDEFIRASWEDDLDIDVGEQFDVVLLAESLERAADPLRLLRSAATHLAPHGKLLASMANVVHWSVRLQLLLGRFDYTNKGILDRRHKRFFTRASALRLFDQAGLEVIEERKTPIPWEKVIPPALGSFIRDKVEKADYLAAHLRPSAFAYQYVFELQPGAPID